MGILTRDTENQQICSMKQLSKHVKWERPIMEQTLFTNLFYHCMVNVLIVPFRTIDLLRTAAEMNIFGLNTDGPTCLNLSFTEEQDQKQSHQQVIRFNNL